MGFWSSFAGSAGSGIGSGLTTGINSWIRGLDRDFLGGALGIDKYNSEFLKQDTYDSAYSNARASSDAFVKFYPSIVKTQRKALEGAGYNPLLAVSNGLSSPMSAFSGSAIAPSSGSGGDFTSDAVRKKQEDVVDEQIDGQRINNEVGEAQKDKIEAETRDIKASTGLKQVGMATAAGVAAATSAVKGKEFLDSFKKVKPITGFGKSISTGFGKSTGSVGKSVGKGLFRGLGSKALGNIGLGLLVDGVFSAMKGAQDKARSEGRTSFTHHMSAGW